MKSFNPLLLHVKHFVYGSIVYIDFVIFYLSVLLGQMGHIESKHLGISDQVNDQYSNRWRWRSVKIFRIVCSVCRAAHPAQVGEALLCHSSLLSLLW